MSDDHADESPSEMGSSSDERGDNREGSSVVALQRLYAVFLPPHLRLNEEEKEEKEKSRKMKNRPLIYTGESRTTAW